MLAELNLLLRKIVEHPDEAFHTVLPAALIGAAAAIALHLLLVLLRRPASPIRRKRWSLWEKLTYLAVVASVGVLGTTAFYSIFRFGMMGGWMLFAHMIGAGAFVVVLPLIALTWAEASRFCPWRGQAAPAGDSPRFFWLPKAMFWILLASGLVVATTMLVSMLPLFGTGDLLRLLAIHRYSGLVAVTAVIFHGYSVLLQRVGWR